MFPASLLGQTISGKDLEPFEVLQEHHENSRPNHISQPLVSHQLSSAEDLSNIGIPISFVCKTHTQCHSKPACDESAEVAYLLAAPYRPMTFLTGQKHDKSSQ
jgi:hypothetical protein